MLVRRSFLSSLIAFLALGCADSAGGGDTTAPRDEAPPTKIPDAPPAVTPPAGTPPAPPPCDDAHPPTNDAKNCGRCGHDCLGGQCAGGECRPYAVASGLDEAPIAIALDGADVWWISNNGSIFTCPLAGCATPKHVLLTKEGTLTSIAIDATYVYYTSFGTAANGYVDGAVVRVDKSGANPTTLASSQHKPAASSSTRRTCTGPRPRTPVR
jgi:hypothetical protein